MRWICLVSPVRIEGAVAGELAGFNAELVRRADEVGERRAESGDLEAG
jgi:hypothetical protein